jgi:mRNA interferase MazF
MVVRRFEVWLVNLDPAMGKKIKKIRPCLIVSPDGENVEIKR